MHTLYLIGAHAAYLATEPRAFADAIARHAHRRRPSESSARGSTALAVKFIHPHDGLSRSGRLGGGIALDVRRRLNPKMYASDWVDGCNLKSIAAGLYMFFGCLAPGIAFGAAVQVATAGRIGVIECALAPSRLSSEAKLGKLSKTI